MQAGVAGGVEAGEADEADGADGGEDDAEAEEDLLGAGDVGGEAAAVAEPTVGGEGQVQQHRRGDAADDEQRLQFRRPHVRDERDRLPILHRLIHHPVRHQDPVQ